MAKLSKAESEYTDQGTRQEHCSICEHYRGEPDCDVVAGEIISSGWCNQFEKDLSVSLRQKHRRA